jgi:hypothetical protein
MKIKTFTACPSLVVSNSRAESDAARAAGGTAEDAVTSTRMVMDVLEGKREGDVGIFVQ